MDDHTFPKCLTCISGRWLVWNVLKSLQCCIRVGVIPSVVPTNLVGFWSGGKPIDKLNTSTPSGARTISGVAIRTSSWGILATELDSWLLLSWENPINEVVNLVWTWSGVWPIDSLDMPTPSGVGTISRVATRVSEWENPSSGVEFTVAFKWKKSHQQNFELDMDRKEVWPTDRLDPSTPSEGMPIGRVAIRVSE